MYEEEEEAKINGAAQIAHARMASYSLRFAVCGVIEEWIKNSFLCDHPGQKMFLPHSPIAKEICVRIQELRRAQNLHQNNNLRGIKMQLPKVPSKIKMEEFVATIRYRARMRILTPSDDIARVTEKFCVAPSGFYACSKWNKNRRHYCS